MIQDMIYHIILLLYIKYDTDNNMIQDILISVNIYIYILVFWFAASRCWSIVNL